MTARQDRKLSILLKEFASRNIKLIQAPLHLSFGGITKYKNQWWCIVSGFDPLPTRIETLAHELAHHVLHQQDRRATNDPSLELEAAQWAKAFLASR